MGKINNKVSDPGLTNQLKKGTVITGDLSSKSDARIDGVINGNVTIEGRVVIGETGEINGDIKCNILEVSGKITGNLDIKERLTLKLSANFTGNMKTEKLIIEPGAIFNGSCKMGELNGGTFSEKKQRKTYF